MAKETFVLTTDHLKLLGRMYVGWQDCEYGAPEIDPKRPYGNSDVEEDVAEILGWKLKFDPDYDRSYPNKDQCQLAAKLHKETETALQIVLKTGCFRSGKYELTEKYDTTSWRPVE